MRVGLSRRLSSKLFQSRFFEQRHHDPLLLLKEEKLMLRVEVIGARELFGFKKGTVIDPYVVTRLGASSYKSDVAKRTNGEE
jgi:hypothetical protein